MKTYQDLLNVGKNEQARMDFCLKAVNEYRSCTPYKVAVDAELYYNGENPTINKYEKILYDMRGAAHVDMYTANHKIASSFFRLAVNQQVSYLLGNGISFGDKRTAGKLGADFEQKVMLAGRYAQTGGVAYCFWDLDKLHVFKMTEFVPLHDEEDGALKAGIRFWQIAPDKPLRMTLYELDGYTEYIRRKSKNIEVLKPKRMYKLAVRGNDINGTEIYDGENYPTFPIVPLRNNEQQHSELVGKRNTIDALDLSSSNMVNNVDEGNLIYWVLTNCAGMSDLDDAKFIEQLKTTHVSHADGDEGARAEAHTIEAPYQGTQTTIDMLKAHLYEDFQVFDASAVSAQNQSATAIQASYTPLDLKTDLFEEQVTRFLLQILELAGIDDKPTYTRNRIINKAEETQTLLMGAQYYDDEYILRKLLTLNGDADMFDEIMARRENAEVDRLAAPVIDEETDVMDDEE